MKYKKVPATVMAVKSVMIYHYDGKKLYRNFFRYEKMKDLSRLLKMISNKAMSEAMKNGYGEDEEGIK